LSKQLKGTQRQLRETEAKLSDLIATTEEKEKLFDSNEQTLNWLKQDLQSFEDRIQALTSDNWALHAKVWYVLILFSTPSLLRFCLACREKEEQMAVVAAQMYHPLFLHLLL